MNIQHYLRQKGYTIKTININGMFNVAVFRGDKKIVHIKAPPDVPVSPEEFDIQVSNLIVNQIETYEMEEANERKEEGTKDSNSNQGCEEVCSPAEEPSKVS